MIPRTRGGAKGPLRAPASGGESARGVRAAAHTSGGFESDREAGAVEWRGATVGGAGHSGERPIRYARSSMNTCVHRCRQFRSVSCDGWDGRNRT